MLKEGRAILRAIMGSFAKAGCADVFTIDGAGQTFENALHSCDAVLIVAPETDGMLESYIRKASALKKVHLGCSPEAVMVTGDKLEFSRLMEKAGIAHPETVVADGSFESSKYFPGAWVLKPRDGAGADGLSVFGGPKTVKVPPGPHIAQEFIPGEPMSLSIVSGAHWLKILSINRQRFTKAMAYDGGEVSGEGSDDVLQRLALKINTAIPCLRGYWGVDYVMTSGGPVVIEVNPRLTTSVCGLVDAIEPTPASFILASANGSAAPLITSRKAVHFTKTGETQVL